MDDGKNNDGHSDGTDVDDRFVLDIRFSLVDGNVDVAVSMSMMEE